MLTMIGQSSVLPVTKSSITIELRWKSHYNLLACLQRTLLQLDGGHKQLVAVNPIDAWRWAAAVTEPCHRTKRTAYSSVIWQMLLLSVCPVPRLDCTAYCAPLNVAITTLVTHRPNLNGAKNKHWLLKRPHLFPWGTHLYVTFIYLVFI